MTASAGTDPTSGLSSTKRALLAVEGMTARLQRLEAARTEPIAIVGAGLRLPGDVASLDAFWSLLREGRHVSVEVPAERWDASAYFDPDPARPGKMCAKVGGFLEDVAGFDPEFFGISPREALTMDPQQRLLLETAYEALEDAGQPVAALSERRVGVFVGIMSEEYAVRALQGYGYAAVDPHFYSGNGASFAAGRLSFSLGVRGPALAVNTACSSSLVAVHLAVQSLRAGESDLALAGGVSLMISPLLSIVLTKAGLLAPDGMCKTFDDRADGIGRGEGAALIALKRLSDALADGDRVLALVRGSAMNHDGRSGGLTAPSGPAQEELIRTALTSARVTPGQVGYVEAHGTGTPLGDPIEIHALAEVFGPGRFPDAPLRIGSVKTNFGHLDSAAGIAGLLKTVAALRHRQIPPHLHLGTPTRHVAWERLPFAVPDACAPWERGDGGRIAGVSSFGLSGVNAHVVLEEAPRSGEVEDVGARAGRSREGAAARIGEPRIVALSARAEAALRQRAEDLRVRLADSGEAPGELDDVAHTSTVRRDHHEHRVSVLARSGAELVDALDAFRRDEADPALITASGRPDPSARARRKLVFVFPGHGQQWGGMGRALIETEPVFAQAIAECDEAFRPWVDWSLLEVLAAGGPRADPERLYLRRTDILQPTVFAIGVALARLWRAWGLEPHAVVGHSLGEITAAHVAGALDLDDAARVICQRGLLTREASGGAMALLAVPEAEAAARIADHAGLCVAAVNGPRSVAVSGDEGAVLALLAEMERQGVPAFRIAIEYASHSAHMEPLLERFQDALAPLRPHAAELVLYSTVTAAPLEGERLDARHWVRNLREPVRFRDTTAALLRDGHAHFIECGAHPVLGREIDAVIREREAAGTVVGSMRRGGHGRAPLLEAAARLYTSGCDLEWSRVQKGGRFRPLPTYPWQRQRYWLDAAPAATSVRRTDGGHPLLGPAAEVATRPEVRAFDAWISPADVEWLSDHRVGDQVVMPGSAWMEMAHASVRASGEPGDGARLELTDAEFIEMLVFTGGAPHRRVQVVVEPDGSGTRRVTAWSRADEGGEPWTCHFRARARIAPALPGAPDADGDDETSAAALRAASARCGTPMSEAEHVAGMEAEGLAYGPWFQTLGDVRLGEGEAVATVRLAPGAAAHGDFGVHPALLDGCLQVVRRAAPDDPGGTDSRLLPVGVERFALHGPIPAELTCHAVLRRHDASGLSGALFGYDSDGRLRLELEGVHLRRVTRPLADAPPEWFHQVVWRERPRLPLATAAPPVRRWLIVPDRGGFVDGLQARLTGLGHGVERTSVAAGAGPAEWRSELERRLGEADPPGAVVVLRGLDHVDSDLSALRTAERDSTLALLGVVQGMLAQTAPRPPWVCVVTRGAQAVGRSAAGGIQLAQTPLLGLLRTVGNEAPELAPLAVDLPTEPFAGELDALVAELLTAIVPDEGTRESEVALRPEARYAPRLVSAPQPAGTVSLDAGATYLITGGFGALGLEVARWLAERGARSLALVGRSGPGGDAEPVLRAIEELGVTVHRARADLSDPRAVRALLAEVRRDLPTLKGVIHCAGVLADATLPALTAESFRRVAAPKIDAAWNLHAATRSDPLDLFVLFSSVSGVLGTTGQANYAAANAFLDGLADHRRALGLPALSIAWGAWRDVGLAAAEQARGKRLEGRGLDGMPTARALAAFGRAIAGGATRLAVTPFDVGRWAALHPRGARAPFLEELARPPVRPSADAVARVSLAEAIEGASEADGARTIEKHLGRAVAQVLGFPPERIDPSKPFADMGLDSLLTVELRNLLDARLGVALPVTVFWEHPTLRALSEHVSGVMGAGAVGPAPSQPESPPDTERDAEMLRAIHDLAALLDVELPAEGRGGARDV
jgi:myxalamid-type polyketide synthase MxaE and MxaD